jgi:hypothetical protein
MNYWINWSNGAVTEWQTLDDAQSSIINQYPDAVFGEWEPSSINDDGLVCEDRMLAWESEVTAGPEGLGDDGSQSVCEIVRSDT